VAHGVSLPVADRIGVFLYQRCLLLVPHASYERIRRPSTVTDVLLIRL
jgi:hypothetical protein